MNGKSKTLVFFGNERLSSGYLTTAPTLTSLIKAGYIIKAVVVNQASNNKRRPLEITNIALKNKIPVLCPAKLIDIYDQLRNIKAEAGVLVAYGKVIPKEIIGIFPCGILNIHPSLLPLYRGPSPIEQAILDGATQTGVSIMQLTATMDAGPIYAQHSVILDGHETKQALTTKLLNAGVELLLNTLTDIYNGQLQPQPQNEQLATYSPLISITQSNIDWNITAAQIERQIRAYAGWPKSHGVLGTLPIIITKAKVVPNGLGLKPGQVFTNNNARIYIGCQQDALQITQLQPIGKKIMTAKDFLNGYKNQIAQQL